jgi:hypothetical protein
MNRMMKSAATCLSSAVLLAGCGGGSPSAPPTATLASLTGNWSGERQNPGGVAYYSETLIAESGAGVLLTHCNRTTEQLTRNGSQLFDREGKLYFLYVRDATTLAARPDLPLGSVMRKRGSAARFDSGSASVTLPSGETLAATADVCAEGGTGRFEDTRGNQASPYIVTVSLPYRDSFIRVDIAFRQIGVGEYQVVGFEPFVSGGANVVTVTDFTSPALPAPDGGFGFMIVSGTVQVSSYTATSITMSADLKAATGEPVKFTASVRLQPRTYADAAQ